MEEQRGTGICRKGGQISYRATELKSNGKDKLRSPVTEHTKSVTLRVHLYLPLVTRANFLPPSSISPFSSTTLFGDHHSSVFPCYYCISLFALKPINERVQDFLLSAYCLLLSCLAYSSNLSMEAKSFSETSVIFHRTNMETFLKIVPIFADLRTTQTTRKKKFEKSA
jgi:hypothetical protein